MCKHPFLVMAGLIVFYQSAIAHEGNFRSLQENEALQRARMQEFNDTYDMRINQYDPYQRTCCGCSACRNCVPAPAPGATQYAPIIRDHR